LPALLGARALDALTVVFHSVSTVYLREDERVRLDEIFEAEGERGSLARVSYEFARDEIGYESFALDVQTWPGEFRRLARLDGHANGMEWLA
jgi:hypothetical protein